MGVKHRARALKKLQEGYATALTEAEGLGEEAADRVVMLGSLVDDLRLKEEHAALEAARPAEDVADAPRRRSRRGPRLDWGGMMPPVVIEKRPADAGDLDVDM